jgi:peptidoglycan/LPS O-acetylase OafA/YrhL
MGGSGAEIGLQTVDLSGRSVLSAGSVIRSQGGVDQAPPATGRPHADTAGPLRPAAQRLRPAAVAALVLTAAGLLLVLTAMQEAGLPVLLNDRVIRLVLMFLLGAASYLYADRIPVRGDLAAAAAGLLLVSLGLFDDYRVLGAAPLAYLLLWAGTCLLPPWSMRADLSYGIYIYHWPLQQILVLTALGTAPAVVFVPVSIALALLPAAASWYLVERPALRHKNSSLPDRFARRLATAFAPAPDPTRLRRS